MNTEAKPDPSGVSWKALGATALVGIIIWMIPSPEGIEARAWHLLAIFVATIAGLMLKPLPSGAVAFLGITVTAVTGTLSITESLSGFGNRIIWLIVIAFLIARGFIKTGLGARIAWIFVAAFGKKSLGLAYGIAATDLILSPVIPSNTARSGAVIFPILRSLAGVFGSDPEQGTSRKIGAFLMKTAFQVTVVTSAMFLTAMAGNLLAVKFAGDAGIKISWSRWALAAAVPGLVSLLIIPLFIYRFYPPEIIRTPEAREKARSQLKKMGPMSTPEWILLVTFFILLSLWIFGGRLNIDSTTTAFAGLGILLAGGVLTWNDILSEKGAWNTLIWFAALVMMASYLNELGFIPWFGQAMGSAVQGSAWIPAFLFLSLIYFYSHYLFASNTAHISSMYAPFLAVSIAVGTPPMLAALVLAFFSNLFSSMTHYSTGPAPVYFGSGYVSMGTWWKLGALISIVNIFIWLGIGGLWWKLLGLW